MTFTLMLSMRHNILSHLNFSNFHLVLINITAIEKMKVTDGFPLLYFFVLFHILPSQTGN